MGERALRRVKCGSMCRRSILTMSPAVSIWFALLFMMIASEISFGPSRCLAFNHDVVPQILICDDSSFARQQMARALPSAWNPTMTFAADGIEGVAAIRAGKGELVFLDLNMPNLDGYGVLQVIEEEALSCRVIVVSGDIQPEARARVMQAGAEDFIQKPVDQAALGPILARLGLDLPSATAVPWDAGDIDVMDGLREVANVAMGRAGDLLARLLEVFVELPLPQVSLLESGELQMALEHAAGNDGISALCQGFIGGGIAGEALLLLHDSSYDDLAALLHRDESLSDAAKIELLMDTASLLTGACLNGLADQLDTSFSLSHPMLLGERSQISEMIRRNKANWRSVLTIELAFAIEHHNISANMMLLFTDGSLPAIKKHLNYHVG